MGDWQLKTNQADESANQRGEKSLSRFLTTGLYNGAVAGFISSLGFIILIVIIFGIITGSFNLTIAVFIIAISFGFFPVMVIACLFGLISGFIYFILQDRLTDAKRPQIISLLLSVTVALSAVTFWSSFALNGFKVEGVQFSWEFYLFFAPFCVAGGLYVGKKLNQLIIDSNNFDVDDYTVK